MSLAGALPGFSAAFTGVQKRTLTASLPTFSGGFVGTRGFVANMAGDTFDCTSSFGAQPIFQLSEAVALPESFLTSAEITAYLTDAQGFSTQVVYVAQALHQDGVTLTESTPAAMTKLAVLAEILAGSEASTLAVQVYPQASDAFTLDEQVVYLARALAGDQLGLSEQLLGAVRNALVLRDQLALTGATTTTLVTLARLIEALALLEALAYADAVSVSDVLALTPQIRFAAILQALAPDTLALLESLTSQSVFVAAPIDQLALEDGGTLSLTLLAAQQDILLFIGRLPLGEGDYQAWCLNTRTLGASQYTQMPFNSYAQVDGRLYGAMDDGVYALTGDDDAGSPIEAFIRTGDLQFGAQNRTRVVRGYLYLASDDECYLKTISTSIGQRTERWYKINMRSGSDEQTRRVDLARGVIGTHWAFEIANTDGGSLDLRNAQVLPLVLRRAP